MESPVRAPGAKDHNAPRQILVSAYPQSHAAGENAREGICDPVPFRDFVTEEGCNPRLLSEAIRLGGLRAEKGYYDYDELLAAWGKVRPPEGMIPTTDARAILGSAGNLDEIAAAYVFGNCRYWDRSAVVAYRKLKQGEKEAALQEARSRRDDLSRGEKRRRAERALIEARARRKPAPRMPVPAPRLAPGELTSREAAARLGISIGGVLRAIGDGRLRARKEGGINVIAEADLGAYQVKTEAWRASRDRVLAGAEKPEPASGPEAPPLSTFEAAKVLGITLGSLCQLVKKGQLTGTTSPSRRLEIPARAVAHYREKHPRNRRKAS